MKKEELYRKVIEKNGVGSQIDMFTEEAGELLSAINKFRRGRTSIDNVCQEIADVMIMCEQLAMIFDEQKVDNWKAYKLERLEKVKLKKMCGDEPSDDERYSVVRDIRTHRIFQAEFSEIAGEWYERHSGRPHSIQDVEIIML